MQSLHPFLIQWIGPFYFNALAPWLKHHSSNMNHKTLDIEMQTHQVSSLHKMFLPGGSLNVGEEN